jgi:hypothetical protein
MPLAGDQFELNPSAKTAGNIAMADVKLIKGAFKYYATAAEMNALDPALFTTGQIVWVEDSGSLYKATVTLADYITTFSDSVSFSPFSFPSSGSGGGGTPGGSPGEIQFNDGGSFGGDPRFIFAKSTGLAQLSGSLQITGSTDNIFLIKSGSVDLLRVSSSGAIVFGDLQHTPPPVAGGFFYSSSAFYVGIE